MRCKKNITLNLRNITNHFTGKAKIITLASIIIMLSSINIINTSALSYSNSVDIGFTFNPTLSLNISSSDLIIPNLTPGTTDTSNEISVNISTNSAYGYTLSAGVSNNNLVHSNNTNIFSSIATTANLPSLTTDNTWGYSTSLDNGVSWSNYNGLSSSNNTELISTNYKAQDIMNFKIAARAGNAQPSGTYTNVVTFYAATKPAVTTLLDAYKAVYPALGQKNGYYKMQDMTPEICSAVEEIPSDLQVIDIRDDKVYWITKLKDGHCWMTQNLDLDLIQNKTYTHADTDLGWSPNDFNINASWTPTSDLSWAQNKTAPYYVDPGDEYVYTSNSDADDTVYTTLSSCTNAGHTDCQHYHIGNYYNWNAARADGNDNTSICPAGWRLPNLDSNEYGNLLVSYNIIQNNTSTTYLENGFNNMRKAPLYFIRAGAKGDISSTDVAPGISGGTYFYNKTTTYASYMNFKKTTINPIWNNQYAAIRRYGESIRCLAR